MYEVEILLGFLWALFFGLAYFDQIQIKKMKRFEREIIRLGALEELVGKMGDSFSKKIEELKKYFSESTAGFIDKKTFNEKQGILAEKQKKIEKTLSEQMKTLSELKKRIKLSERGLEKIQRKILKPGKEKKPRKR